MSIEPSQPLFEGLWLHNEYDGRAFDVMVENGVNRLDIRSVRGTDTIGVHVITARTQSVCKRDTRTALPQAACLICLGAARINSPARQRRTRTPLPSGGVAKERGLQAAERSTW